MYFTSAFSFPKTTIYVYILVVRQNAFQEGLSLSNTDLGTEFLSIRKIFFSGFMQLIENLLCRVCYKMSLTGKRNDSDDKLVMRLCIRRRGKDKTISGQCRTSETWASVWW